MPASHARLWRQLLSTRLLPALMVLGLIGPPALASALGVAVADTRTLRASEVEPGDFPKRLRDPLGQTRVLVRPPTRIVSAMLAADEMLLDLVDPKRLSGLTFLVDDPTTTLDAYRAPAGVARVHGEVEPIVALEPDLVIVAGFTAADAVVELLAAGLPVVRLDQHDSFEGIERDLEKLGRATGEQRRAQSMVADLRARLAAVAAEPAPIRAPRVLYWSHGSTAGQHTLLDECIRRAGGVNVAAEAGIQGRVPIGIEFALSTEPDIVIVSVTGQTTRSHAPELLSPKEHWQALAAYRRGNVFGIPSAWLSSVSQHAVLALEALASILHGRPS